MPLSPPVQWAQRTDRLYITIDLQDCKEPQITVANDAEAKAGRLTFRGKAHSHATGPEEHQYALDLELNGEIDDSDTKQVKTDRTVSLIIGKKEPGPYWPRLLKAVGRTPANIKVDWDRWVDEDEEGDGGLEADGFDLSALQNLGGGGGGMPDFSALAGGSAGLGDFGVEDENSSSGSDDGDLPPLEAQGEASPAQA